MRKRDVEMHHGQCLSSAKLRTQTSKQMMTTECGGGDSGGKHRVSGGGGEGHLPHKAGIQTVGNCYY